MARGQSLLLRIIWVLRRVLHPLSVVESMEFLSSKLSNFRSNAEFLDMMDKM